jgi:hypothetical protein
MGHAKAAKPPVCHDGTLVAITEKEHFTVKPQATSAVVPAGTIIDVATVHIVASLALLSAIQ